MDNEKNSKLGSRSENKGKKRKVNRIYNILLTIVIVAIIAVAIPIFWGNDDNQSDLADDTASENYNDNNKDLNTDKDSTKKEEEIADDTEKDHSNQDEADEENNDQEVNEGNTIVENSDDSNVQETYINDSWKPVGTTQTGEHVTNYSMDSVDWKEMKQAIAYGVGLSEDNMTVWYIGNGGATNKAIGTVSSKDASGTAYRVYIEWVDGQGWKPEKVELLKQNDKLH